MASFSFLSTLTILFNVAAAEVGCSDYGCSCHPDEKCHPEFTVHNPCHKTKTGCWGPVIATTFAIDVNESIAQSMLPHGLKPVASNNTYKLRLIFNQQHNVGAPEVDWNYLEFIVGLNVQWDAQHALKYPYKGPFLYNAKLYLDKLDPTEGGRQYGVNKEVTHMEQSCDMHGNCNYVIYAPHNRNEILISAQWNPMGNYTNKTNTSDVAAPFIGKYPVDTGKFQCRICMLYKKYSMVQQVNGEVTIHKSFYGDIPTGTWQFDTAERVESMWKFKGYPSPLEQTCTGFNPYLISYLKGNNSSDAHWHNTMIWSVIIAFVGISCVCAIIWFKRRNAMNRNIQYSGVMQTDAESSIDELTSS